ncbi:pyridoxamine 5'-phosphate oxidase [Aeromicrobium sp. CF4.19]|uniref:pyridoxamine 5'-phosphate oxidase n=1 Tax=Aeromicrobium sp. CF4.19 TaxID=3373082 RepID=UPI003EE51E4B
MGTPDLAAMRTEYARSGLDEADAGTDPMALFRRWLDDAIVADVHEPNAMALATATPDGLPSVRIVLLKQLDDAGVVFYTGYTSRKGAEIEANPHAAAVMLWHPLQRQVRVEGPVARIPSRESDAYFTSRPPGSRLGAVASPQSQVIADRDELEQRFERVEASVGDGPVQRPETWGGYRIEPTSVEFWQGRADRLHDRLRFRRAGDQWRRERLAP